MYIVSYIVLSCPLLKNAIKLEIMNALKERLTKYVMYNNTTILYMNEFMETHPCIISYDYIYSLFK